MTRLEAEEMAALRADVVRLQEAFRRLAIEQSRDRSAWHSLVGYLNGWREPDWVAAGKRLRCIVYGDTAGAAPVTDPRSVLDPRPVVMSARQWMAKLYPGMMILDPDGWRTDGTPLDTEITEADFRQRFAESTSGPRYGRSGPAIYDSTETAGPDLAGLPAVVGDACAALLGMDRQVGPGGWTQNGLTMTKLVSYLAEWAYGQAATAETGGDVRAAVYDWRTAEGEGQ